MNKRVVLLFCCIILLSVLAYSGTAQEEDCNLDVSQVYTVLESAIAADAAGDMVGALANLDEAFTRLENIRISYGDSITTGCGQGALNWCYPGQPWGDGRCNGPDLSQEQMDWFWTCGTYWAEYEHGLLEVVPGWCGFDTDGDGYPNDVDQCPGAPDQDSDGDGFLDCHDQCPADPSKVALGACGCGVPDIGDGDGDGILDCVDPCPGYPNTSCTVDWCQTPPSPSWGVVEFGVGFVDYTNYNPGLPWC